MADPASGLCAAVRFGVSWCARGGWTSSGLCFPVEAIKYGKGRCDCALEQHPFGPDARQHAHAHEHPEEMTSEIFSGYGTRDRAVRLTCLDAIEEERLDTVEHARDDLLKLRVVRRHFEGR